MHTQEGSSVNAGAFLDKGFFAQDSEEIDKTKENARGSINMFRNKSDKVKMKANLSI